MEVDSTTYGDLSLIQHEGESSIFHRLNFTRTAEGKEWLLRYFRNPFSDSRQIRETQQIIRLIRDKIAGWPESISNGTLMVMIRFFESNIDTIPSGGGIVNALSYKVFHSPDYSLVKYSTGHFADFLLGMKKMIELLDHDDTPVLMKKFLQRARDIMSNHTVQSLSEHGHTRKFTPSEVVHYGRYIRHEFKNKCHELINIYGRIDAWYSMAVAFDHFRLCFPDIEERPQPSIRAEGLYHVLLPEPVPYDIEMDISSNFIFLTGANMAGKSTFIRAVGCAVFLAHLGMGVPAKKMQLNVFDGLLSNINVMDNLVKGESYFFNEVQRIKNTIIKINDGRKWLVLIDELFKGTNVQDAMKCSSAVIRGLIKIPHSLFILSTHLYEIGESLREYPKISFKYFETTVKDEQLEFSYQLKEGISNDRIGYVILKREKVVEMLDNL